MKLATTMGFFYEKGGQEILTPSQTLHTLSQTGFRQFNYSFNWRPHYNTDAWREIAEESAETAAQYGMLFPQAHAPVGDLLHDDEYIELVKRSIEICSIIGCPCAAMHLHDIPGGPSIAHTKEVWAANKKALERIIPTLEKYNVALCIENEFDACAPQPNRRFAFSTAQEIKDFIEYVGHPLLGACLDVGHANVQHLDVPEQIHMLGNLLMAVHISDNDGNTDMHTGPFGGSMDFDGIIQALLDIGYRGAFAFEAKFMHKPPTSLKVEYNKLLYAAGKYLLEKNGCCEG